MWSLTGMGKITPLKTANTLPQKGPAHLTVMNLTGPSGQNPEHIRH
ncbi:hypothetical protein GP924_25070 [Enterobacteriaceae bacterium 8376wB9]|nr:hypothetical protein [Enterobacteriaceae bacterium 8376wB9]